MRAVVLGGNGFIGSHLVDLLLQQAWTVSVVDPLPERYRAPLPSVHYIAADMSDSSTIRPVLADADVVFHLSSTTVPATSNADPIADIQQNLMPTVAILQQCVEQHVGKFVFVSSGGTVYGIPPSLPVHEEMPTNPICAYGIVKLAIEKYLQLYHRLYELPYVILRPSNAYGPRQYTGGQQGVVAHFMSHLAAGRPLELWGDGSVVRDFIHVRDLARACYQAAVCATSDRVFNIGSGVGTSMESLIEIMHRVADKPVRIVRYPERRFDVPQIILDSRHAAEQLGWTPEVTLDQGIRDTWQWVSSLAHDLADLATGTTG